jgi:dTDP-4-dehydrorhamnose 3,5-epimerase
MNLTDNIRIFEPSINTDFRGDLWTIWKKNDWESDLKFNHDKVSTSRKHVLRGIHGDDKSYKLVTCLYGEIYFVVVNNILGHPDYLKVTTMVLDDKSRKQVLIPPRFGNGFLVLSDMAVFHYKWAYPGEYPDVKDQFTLKWNDPRLNIYWPIKNPILSERDA